MMLDILLPREGEGCNPNRGRCLHRFRQAADAKEARTLARLLTLEQMRRKGVAAGEFTPRFAVLVTFWNGHNVDVDNAAACMKAYQDGVFDALGTNDRGLLSLFSVKMWTPDRAMHRKKQLALFDDEMEANEIMARMLPMAAQAEAERGRKKK